MSSYGEGSYRCKKCGVVRPGLRLQTQLVNKDWQNYCPNCNSKLSPIATNEEAKQQSNSVYAITKKNQEEMVLTIGKAYQIPSVALRFFNVYGPRQSLSNPYTGVCAIFISRLKNKKRPVIYEDGNQTRDFISVHDIVQANMLAMESKSAEGEIFNVGTGRATEVSELAQELSRIYGRHGTPAVVYKFRWGDVRHIILNSGKLAALGFRAETRLNKGLEQFAEWMASQGKVEEYFSAAYDQLKRHRLIDE